MDKETENKHSIPRRNAPRNYRLAANVMEEEGWDDQSGSNMKLSRAFVVVLILHVVAVGGILAFQAIEKSGRSQEVAEESPELPPKVVDQPVVPARTVPEDLRSIQINQPEMTSSLAALYSISEEELLNVNPNLASGIINVGARVYLPRSAREPAQQELPMAEAVDPPAGEALVSEEAQTAQAPQPTPVQPVPRSPNNSTRQTNNEPREQAAPSSGNRTYTMQPGDNPYRVALKFGITQDELMRANGITDPTKVPAGKVLIIPGN